MTELSLFSGAGGGLLATKHLLGFTTVGYVEKDKYCQQVLRARIKDGLLDDAPIFNDVRTFDGLAYRGKVDCITAGFPCQPFSVAGKQRGKDDERNCWPDTVRIIREVQPGCCFLENVPGLLTSGYFGTILQDLWESGFNARWCVLSASALGAPHRRRRLWILAYSKHRSWTQSGRSSREGRQDKAKLTDDGSQEFMAYTRRELRNEIWAEPREDKPLPDIHDKRCGENVSNTAKKRSQRAELQQEESIKFAEHQKLTNSSWWAVEPDVGRVANGVANRVDRLKALGNGQVPIVAATAFRQLVDDKG